LVLDLKSFSLSHPNPTHLPKQESPSPDHQFSQRILYVHCNIILCMHTWREVRNFAIQKFRLTLGQKKRRTLNPAAVDSSTPDPWTT